MRDARACVIGSRKFRDFTLVSVAQRAKVGAKVLASRLSTLSMSPRLSSAARRALAAAAATFTLLAMAIGLSGCPVAAPLEDDNRFPALSTGGSSNGGSSTGGSAGGGDDCRRPLPTNVSCDWKAALGARGGPAGYCAKSGCHNATNAVGGLDLTTVLPDLTEDQFFIARLLNVPAKYEIDCPGNMECVTDAVGGSTCPDCAMCVPGKVLVSTTAPGTGWIFDKINAFIPGTTTATLDIGCGDAMPTYNTPGTANYSQDHKNCLIEFFTEVAKTPGTWPCGQTGGAGSGAGGSAGAGAGSGGAAAGTGGASTAGAGGT
jgi:uncharacterized membrane protein YgcG